MSANASNRINHYNYTVKGDDNVKLIDEIILQDVMPSNLLKDSNTNAIAESLNNELGQVSQVTREALILPRLDELDEQVIDMLAWQYHVDFYELADDIDMKRKMVRESLLWHMKKGTKYAIIKALDILGIEAEYKNWYEFEPAHEPYTFEIYARVRDDYYRHHSYEQMIQNIYRMVNKSKAARSLMSRLETEIGRKEEMKIYYGMAQGISGLHSVWIDWAKLPETGIYYGMAQGLSGNHIIKYSQPEKRMEMHITEYHELAMIAAYTIRIEPDSSDIIGE